MTFERSKLGHEELLPRACEITSVFEARQAADRTPSPGAARAARGGIGSRSLRLGLAGSAVRIDCLGFEPAEIPKSSGLGALILIQLQALAKGRGIRKR